MSIRRALTRVIPGNRKSRDMSNSPSPSPARQPSPTNVAPTSPVKSVVNHLNGHAVHPDPDNEKAHPPNGNAATDEKLHRPSPRRLSFTEQKFDRKAEREAKEETVAQARHEKQAHLHEQDPLGDRYGDLPLNMSQSRHKNPLDTLDSIADKQPGDRVRFRARIHHVRPLGECPPRHPTHSADTHPTPRTGAKIVFIILRQQITTVQAILTEEEGKISANMVRWAEGLNRETIVLVEGLVQTPPEDQAEVKSTSIHKYEINVEKIYVVSAPTSSLPFQVDDISKPVSMDVDHHVGDKTRFNNRVLDLRSPASQAIFRIHAAVCHLFREALIERKFIEIQSSKFQESGTESGAAVFKVDYFRRPAFLAQSPQLAKQMCIAADMERVFEIGPVFRAENSNTHRHLTEFTGLDLEMAFESHYEEVMDVIDEVLKHIFKGLLSRYRQEIETVKKQFPHEDVVIPDETVVLKFSEGIQMLRESGWKKDDGSEPSDLEDLSTAAEKKLGQLVKAKYNTDYYILNKFPLAVRPFYTMPDPENEELSNSFDIFLRGEEILSGAQRIHHAPMLEKRMSDLGIDPETMKDYVNGFRWGCPPHGGGGFGLERIVMLFLQLGDVRWASLIPRDPRSFATNGQDAAEASMGAAAAMILHGPESKTWGPGQPRGEMPPLENLIAKYGDATNTSWIDPAWTVWRDENTGGAVGYIPQNGFAVIFGSPLCERRQLHGVIRNFLAHLASPEVNLKPVWCCVDKDTESFLAKELGWSAVIAVAEERLNPVEADPANQDKNVRRKIHRAEREGVKIVEVEKLDDETKTRIEERCKEWAEKRKGTQIHLTGVRPFDDVIHRKYFYATDKDGKICALVVLAQLSPVHGFQIKWALEFPDAPLGAIEYILAFVIKKLGDAGVRTATFGAGATGTLQRVDNVGGFKVRTLEKTYNGISHTFHLTGKGDFRGKFGVEQDPLYICYPKGGLGMRGIEAILAMLQKPK
ncbi:aspartyl-tRNA synthetase, cytoplasmic [Cristinia sonorae]|uniref:aspartate--tRNA ligase n=1 Tax=Cristinia sonorae TaxID=1940300 RepID=A0A8K0UDZ8_9AGAR|nr:aspartyl-tRNA synthetase, cytoplasmic [Cristinia sonorae]